MSAQQNCDIIIQNGCVITMDGSRTIIPKGAVAVKGHTIAAIGLNNSVLRDWDAKTIIDAKGAIVHPGYVEAHLHVNAQTCRGFFRGDASKSDAKKGPNYADWKAALSG